MALALAAMQFAAVAHAANIPAAAVSANPAVAGAVQKADEPPQHWAFDANNGCKVWSADPIGGSIAVRWSGRCEQGLAQGVGTVRWLSSGKQIAELSGVMEQGKLRGHVTGVEEPGNRYDGMYIDSLPEGQGKAVFADGSVYDGQWHRGHQLGYGVMTFAPSHPQYQDMLRNGRGSRADNGMYVLRGWWEGKTFITPCNSEDECEKAVVVLMKLDQDAAAKASAAAPAATPAPAVAAPVEPAAPALEPAAVPAAAPVLAPEPMPAAAAPVAPAPVPAAEPAAVAVPMPTAVESAPEPVNAMPAVVAPTAEPDAVPAPVAPAPEQPASGPAAVVPVPVAQPDAAPVVPTPALPAMQPASEPAAPAAPEPEPAASPKALTPAPGSTDAALGVSEPISNSNGSS